MFGERQVNLQITDRTRASLTRLIARSKLAEPILSISKGRFNDEAEERWSLGLYDRKGLREGWIGISPEFEFVVIQEWVLEALDNQLLDFDEAAGELTLSPLR